jgi:hypothetical protein
LEDAGHRGDFAAQFFPGADEQRQDQLLHVQPCFANQFPQRRRLPQPARAVIWKLSNRQIHEPILVLNREVQSGK